MCIRIKSKRSLFLISFSTFDTFAKKESFFLNTVNNSLLLRQRGLLWIALKILRNTVLLFRLFEIQIDCNMIDIRSKHIFIVIDWACTFFNYLKIQIDCFKHIVVVIAWDFLFAKTNNLNENLFFSYFRNLATLLEIFTYEYFVSK